MGIPHSFSCIPNNNAKDSGFHKPKLPGFRKLDSFTGGETFQWAGGGGAGEGGGGCFLLGSKRPVSSLITKLHNLCSEFRAARLQSFSEVDAYESCINEFDGRHRHCISLNMCMLRTTTTLLTLSST